MAGKKESDAGVGIVDLCRRHGITGVVLSPGEQVRRDEGERGEAALSVRGGEPPTEHIVPEQTTDIRG